MTNKLVRYIFGFAFFNKQKGRYNSQSKNILLSNMFFSHLINVYKKSLKLGK